MSREIEKNAGKKNRKKIKKKKMSEKACVGINEKKRNYLLDVGAFGIASVV